MKYLITVWQGIKNNSGTIIMVTGLLIYLLTYRASIQAQTQVDKDIMSCKTLCFPQQAEYITHGTASSCWCYTNQNTMNKVK